MSEFEFGTLEGLRDAMNYYSDRVCELSDELFANTNVIPMSFCYSPDRPYTPSITLSRLEREVIQYKACSSDAVKYFPTIEFSKLQETKDRLLRGFLLDHYGAIEYLQLIGTRFPQLSVQSLIEVEKLCSVKKVYVSGQLLIEIESGDRVLQHLISNPTVYAVDDGGDRPIQSAQLGD